MQNPWFKNKSYGWGWYPATWQGWLVLGVYVLLLVLLSLPMQNSPSLFNTFLRYIIPVAILTIILVIICYKTGEAPSWHWGDKK